MYVLVVRSWDISTACLSWLSVPSFSQMFTLVSLTPLLLPLLQMLGDLKLDAEFSAADGRTREVTLVLTSGGRLGAIDDTLQVDKPHNQCWELGSN